MILEYNDSGAERNLRPVFVTPVARSLARVHNWRGERFGTRRR